MLHCVHNNSGGSLGGAACKGHLTVWSFVHRSLSALQPGQGLTESQESQLTTALSLEIRNILKRFKTLIRWKWTLHVMCGLIKTTGGFLRYFLGFCWWKAQPVDKRSWEIFSKGSGGQGAVRRSFLLSFNFSSHLTSPRTLSSLKKSALPFLFLRHIFSPRGVQASRAQPWSNCRLLQLDTFDLYWSNKQMKLKVTRYQTSLNLRHIGRQHQQHQTHFIPKSKRLSYVVWGEKGVQLNWKP